ncbi:class I SAM-dependent methyltransferase [Acinetobacter sp. B5B]|uniref:class I SAM-dependent methyltransferase n=1 Tax=Acinetobacter baretiae TaxID=2605383 RepID=UPI0018C20352|nr:class I SAM-dependent methyltransferase [Acinetobacter baretiae]MBF7681794.1 class I SAM-dependent methyltransferase [Acinetobacter baretiae]
MTDTSDYYNQKAQSFFDATYDIDMESLYAPFLQHLNKGGLILDVGCGSGRDILAFKNKGYRVEAIDASYALVTKATELSGICVKQHSFYDLAVQNRYDGIWACASLLHCDRQKLPNVLNRILTALKPHAVCYMSFKYGTTDRKKDGRVFTDLNEQQLYVLIQPLNVEVLQQWITQDKRSDRHEKWLNIIFRKQNQ